MTRKILLTALLTIGFSGTVLAEGRGFYAGAFGGVIRTDSQDVEQTGAAHKFGGTLPHSFDLLVDVKGQVQRDTSGLGGAKIGYEWAANSLGVKPAVELEAMYTEADQKSNLVNPNNEAINYLGASNPDKIAIDAIVYDPVDGYAAGNHRFFNQMKMKMGLFMANGVITYDNSSVFKPYVGAGLGLAVIRMTGATSYQTSPHGDPYEITSNTGEVVNHFNSKTHASDFALAGQVKLGVRAELDKHWSSFAEYRYLWVDSTDFTFGSTVYPGGHSPTDNWNVKNDSMGIHNGLVGLEYAF